jgi:Ribbon-helix-helix protein, copG family
MPRLNVYLPAAVVDRLQAERAAGQPVNVSALLREALERRLAIPRPTPCCPPGCRRPAEEVPA